MNFFEFLFRLFSSKVAISQEDFEAAGQQFANDSDKSNSKVFKILNSPYFKVALALLFPIFLQIFNNWWARLVPDTDNDNDHDLRDALAILSKRLLPND
jgi:hypothetical protein